LPPVLRCRMQLPSLPMHHAAVPLEPAGGGRACRQVGRSSSIRAAQAVHCPGGSTSYLTGNFEVPQTIPHTTHFTGGPAVIDGFGNNQCSSLLSTRPPVHMYPRSHLSWPHLSPPTSTDLGSFRRRGGDSPDSAPRASPPASSRSEPTGPCSTDTAQPSTHRKDSPVCRHGSAGLARGG